MKSSAHLLHRKFHTSFNVGKWPQRKQIFTLNYLYLQNGQSYESGGCRLWKLILLSSSPYLSGLENQKNHWSFLFWKCGVWVNCLWRGTKNHRLWQTFGCLSQRNLRTQGRSTLGVAVLERRWNSPSTHIRLNLIGYKTTDHFFVKVFPPMTRFLAKVSRVSHVT